MSSNEQVAFKDYPVWLWLPGVMTLALAAGIAESAWQRLLLALAGFVLVAFASILTVTVDHRRGTLKLHNRSLFRASTKAYLLTEICFVNVAEDSDRDRLYRVELILRSGEVVPLRYGYSIGKARKERSAQRLRSMLRVGNEAPATGIRFRPP